MAYETYKRRVVEVDAPDPLPIRVVDDDGRLLFIANGVTTVVFESDRDGDFHVGNGTVRLDLYDPRTGDTPAVAKDDYGAFLGEANDDTYIVEEGTRFSRSFRHEDDSSRIVSTYEDGEYSGLTPGVLGHEIRQTDMAGVEAKTIVENTTTFDVSGAPVKENATYGDLKFDHTPGTREVAPSFVFANPANHGLTVDVRLTATVGGQTVADDTITTTLTGTIGATPKRNRVDAPTFRLPVQAAIQGRQVEYTIAPQVDYIDNATGAYRPPPATEWVSLACSVNPEEVTVGETFNVGATWKCDDGATVDVPISYVVSAGGAENDGTATVPAGLNEQLDISSTFEPTEEGELQPTIRWNVQ